MKILNKLSLTLIVPIIVAVGIGLQFPSGVLAEALISGVIGSVVGWNIGIHTHKN